MSVSASASFAAAERLAQTLLYEGYVLYPYRRSSLKNRQRWPLGALYPPAFCAQGGGDASAMQTECVIAGSGARVQGCVRFLQLLPGEDDGTGPWHHAVERRIEIPEVALDDIAREPWQLELDVEGKEPLCARVSISAVQRRDAYRLRVSIENVGECAPDCTRGDVLPRVLCSTHTLLACRNGRFVSLLEPPSELQAETAVCAHVGCFPVLVGEPGADDLLLASPIILYDRPRIAPESAGDFFDATEVDELLTLRVLTLTEAERAEAMRSDPRVQQLLARTDGLDPAALGALHGAQRIRQRLPCGTRVRIKPRPGGDVFDIALAGELATVVKVEEDFEGRVHYAVTIDRDPGRDLGLEGQPGHRFFFARDELEPAS